jgi:hypothetical protein
MRQDSGRRAGMDHSDRVKQAKLDALRRRRIGPSRAASNRLLRTIGLGTAAVVLALFWLAREFQLDVDELFGYLRISALFVLGFAVSGALGFAVLWLVRRFK